MEKVRIVFDSCYWLLQEAADFYKGEESRSSAAKCLVKVAQVVLFNNVRLLSTIIVRFSLIRNFSTSHAAFLIHFSFVHYFSSLPSHRVCVLNLSLFSSLFISLRSIQPACLGNCGYPTKPIRVANRHYCLGDVLLYETIFFKSYSNSNSSTSQALKSII